MAWATTRQRFRILKRLPRAIPKTSPSACYWPTVASHYKVVAWHEGAKSASKQVAVKGDAKADFTVTK